MTATRVHVKALIESDISENLAEKKRSAYHFLISITSRRDWELDLYVIEKKKIQSYAAGMLAMSACMHSQRFVLNDCNMHSLLQIQFRCLFFASIEVSSILTVFFFLEVDKVNLSVF